MQSASSSSPSEQSLSPSHNQCQGIHLPEWHLKPLSSSHELQFTSSIPLRQSQGQMFEYACHEGNYGMEGILVGARAEEANATATRESR